MHHEKTVIYSTSRGKSYHVEYYYSHSIERLVLTEKYEEDNIKKRRASLREGYYNLQARVYEGENCIKLFNRMPPTKIQNPTKSQAQELISIALKEIKQATKTSKKTFKR